MCPVEIKLLLSPSPIQTVITSLRFEKETTGQVYFFDTDALDLQKQGVIVRVRQGANSDLTVKVRVPDGRKQVPIAGLDALFPCEMNWTGAGIDTDYSVNRRYKTLRVPQTGDEISHLLSSAQKSLLQEARLPINWSRVTRIASINATSWESIAQSPFPKLALELWEWPAGSILEVSAKVGSDAGQSKSTELRRLVNRKSLRLSASQGSKTSLVLDRVTRHTARQAENNER